MAERKNYLDLPLGGRLNIRVTTGDGVYELPGVEVWVEGVPETTDPELIRLPTPEEWRDHSEYIVGVVLLLLDPVGL